MEHGFVRWSATFVTIKWDVSTVLNSFWGFLSLFLSESLFFFSPSPCTLHSLVSGSPAQESVSLMLPLNVVEGSVRATVSVTGKEFSCDNTFPTSLSLRTVLGKPKPRIPYTLSEVSEAPTPLVLPCLWLSFLVPDDLKLSARERLFSLWVSPGRMGMCMQSTVELISWLDRVTCTLLCWGYLT